MERLNIFTISALSTFHDNDDKYLFQNNKKMK